MFHQTIVSVHCALFRCLLSEALLIPSVCAGASGIADANDANVQIEVLNPFTHIAYIPAGADLGTIRFEKIRMTSLPTTVKHDANPSYCAEAASRDRSGSIFCPSATPGSFVQAYEAIYSFIGQPVLTDESGTGNSHSPSIFGPRNSAPKHVRL
jgi:hypothetical protein